MTDKHQQHSKFLSRISSGKQLSILLILIMGVMSMSLGTNMAGAISTDAQTAVDLGSASSFAILAKSGISTTGTTHVTGDIGVSPSSATSITGFGLILGAGNKSSTSSLVTGNIYSADYASPTPSMMTTAISDMETAFTTAAGRVNPDETELGAGEIGGLTLEAGLYKWGTAVTISSDVTISGSATDVWVFQIDQDLVLSDGVKVVLSGGAVAKNIFWIVSGQTTVGTTAVLNGNVLCMNAIVFNTGSTLNGRALAQKAVTLDATTVVRPGLTASSSGSTGSEASSDDASFNFLFSFLAITSISTLVTRSHFRKRN